MRPGITRGNSKAYLLARLERDAPEWLARFQKGEFPSVYAAAKAAGIIKKPSAIRQLVRIWEQAAPTEKRAFRTYIGIDDLGEKFVRNVAATLRQHAQMATAEQRNAANETSVKG